MALPGSECWLLRLGQSPMNTVPDVSSISTAINVLASDRAFFLLVGVLGFFGSLTLMAIFWPRKTATIECLLRILLRRPEPFDAGSDGQSRNRRGRWQRLAGAVRIGWQEFRKHR